MNVVTPTPTPVFVNPDGVDAPEGGTETGWSVQDNAPYPGKGKTQVFPQAANYTPATAAGWTVQSANGSDQNLVQSSGV